MAARFVPSSSLAVLVLVVGCHRGGSGDPGDGTTGEPDDVDAICPGVAYARADVPGTALCLDGLDSFQCTWTSKNPAINGAKIEGNHDAANGTLSLAIPDDAAHSSFTTYTFDVRLAVDGFDLVLELMGIRAGAYREVAGWTVAVDGDGGVCGGRGGSCDGPCSSDADCASGQACMATEEGDKCLPTACDTCFDADQTCNYYAVSCEFDACTAALGR